MANTQRTDAFSDAVETSLAQHRKCRQTHYSGNWQTVKFGRRCAKLTDTGCLWCPGDLNVIYVRGKRFRCVNLGCSSLYSNVSKRLKTIGIRSGGYACGASASTFSAYYTTDDWRPMKMPTADARLRSCDADPAVRLIVVEVFFLVDRRSLTSETPCTWFDRRIIRISRYSAAVSQSDVVTTCIEEFGRDMTSALQRKKGSNQFLVCFLPPPLPVCRRVLLVTLSNIIRSSKRPASRFSVAASTRQQFSNFFSNHWSPFSTNRIVQTAIHYVAYIWQVVQLSQRDRATLCQLKSCHLLHKYTHLKRPPIGEWPWPFPGRLSLLPSVGR